MTAALVAANEGSRVLLCEKTAQLGGTTATSGGATWVAGSTHSQKSGAPDTIEAARKYLDGEVGTYGTPALRENVPRDRRRSDRLSRAQLRSEVPDAEPVSRLSRGAAGRRARRTHASRRCRSTAACWAADFALVRPPVPEFMVLGGMMVGRDEIKHLIRPWASVAAMKLSARLVFNYLVDRSAPQARHADAARQRAGRTAALQPAPEEGRDRGQRADGEAGARRARR
jgi:hypothetical protein